MARFARSAPRAVVPLEGRRAASVRKDAQLGALARCLSSAARLGAVVPGSYIVLGDTFRHVIETTLPPGHDPDSLLRTIHRPATVERAAAAREKLLEAVLDADLEREIDAAFRAVSEAAPWGVAVRASPMLPDMAVARAAGLGRTALAIHDREELGRAIRMTWALSVSERTLRYLRAHKIRDLSMAVILEPVVVADRTVTLVSDASFLRDEPSPEAPAPDAGERAILVVAGLGGEHVDLSRAELLLADRAGVVRARRAAAAGPARAVRGGVLGVVDVREPPAPLPEKRVLELTEIARRLGELGPIEVRCVVPPDGDIVVVEHSPLRHEGYPPGGESDTLWGRAAGAEAGDEPLTPLSLSFVVEPAITRTGRVLGADAPRSSRLPSVIATVSGRPFVNLSFFIGHGSNGADGVLSRIEAAGIQWTRELLRETPERSALPRVALQLAQLATEQRTLEVEVASFERDAEQTRRWLSEMDLAILPDDALTTTLQEVRDFLSRAHRLHATASATAVTGHALVASVFGGVDPAGAASLAHAVTAGTDVATSRLPAALCHVAGILRLDEPAKAALSANVDSVEGLPEGPFRRAMTRFLAAYGDRGLVETELAMPRFGEHPAPLFALLRAALRGPPVDPDRLLLRARSLSEHARIGVEAHLSFFETRLARDLLDREREILRLRERCRVRLAQGLALMRTVALDADRRIRRLDPSLETGSALLLALEELTPALRLYRTDLGPLVRSRWLDFARERAAFEPPPAFRGAPRRALPMPGASTFLGLPASPGLVLGRAVRIGSRLEGIDEFSPGDVVVAKSLDLSFGPLLFLAGGIVTELGTPLSSGAVVARDAGVPAVTGIVALWPSVQGGERIRVDGQSGLVELAPS